jgi:hypothetical protein
MEIDVPFPSTPSNTLLDAMPKRDRDAVLSFLTMSSRKTRSAEETLDTIVLSLALKTTHFGVLS